MELATSFDHPAVDAAGAIEAGLDALAAANLWSLPVAEVGRLVVRLEKLARRLAAAQLVALAQADAGSIAQHEGATSTAAWHKAVADVPVGATRARLALHHALRSRPLAAAALAAGNVSVDAATAICTALDSLPAQTPAALTTPVEELLVEVATEEGARAVARTAAAITHRFAPETLEASEARQFEANRLKLVTRHDGSLSLRGVFDKEAGALALAVLEPHAAPAPSTDGMPDLRDGERRYADALIHVLRTAAPASSGVAGQPPHLAVTISLDALRGKPDAAPGLIEESGAPLSAGAARRLACDATIVPVVLAGRSQPLDIGRATRLIPVALRRALIVRDQGCTMPSCDRPPSWCDAHHVVSWADGGDTALHNLVLLCEHHHRTVHHDGWTITFVDHQPHYIPPRWIDPMRKPRLHHRYKTRELDP